MARVPQSVVSVAMLVYIPGVIAGTCYVVIEVLQLGGMAQNLAIAGALLVLLAPALYLLWRLSPTGEHHRRQSDFAQREQERIAKRVAELRGDPRRERFIPLVERGYHLNDERLAKWLVRLDELAAVPHRQRYVEQLLQGREFTDAQIDYFEFPDRLVTCEHLVPVERALKQAGLRPVLLGERHVRVDCQLRFDAVRSTFALPPFVETVDELVDPRDNLFDHRVRCTRCASEIQGEDYGASWPA